MKFWISVLFAAGLCGADSKYELPAGQRTGTIRKLFVVSHSHLDIGFTRSPDQVAREYKDNIDKAIRLAASNEDFRWNIESTWMLEQWLRRTDDPKLVDQLGSLMRQGRISLGAGFANMHSGLMAPEESNRLMYAAEKFRRQFGVPLVTAFQNDVPGFTWAYPRIFSGSGVKYLITGLNLFIGGGNNLGVGKDPFYWVGPDGSRILTWFAYDSYMEGAHWKIVGPAPVSEMEEVVPRRLAWLEHNGYRYDAALVITATGDNIDPAGAMRMLEKVRVWNGRHPELQIQMSTPEDFFSYLTGKYGDKFPEVRGDAAGHWDIRKINTPAATSKLREASNVLPIAEMAATIASLSDAGTFPRFDFSEAWHDLLVFHEHTTGAGAGWPGYWSKLETDWNNAIHYVWSMLAYSNTAQQYRRALFQLAGAYVNSGKSTAPASEGGATCMVFNGLSWKRGGPVHLDRLSPILREGPLDVTDIVTGAHLPYEDVPGTKRQIRFFAPELPASGWRLFRVRKADASVQVNRSQPFGVAVTCAPDGRIVSLRDVASGNELIAANPRHSFGGLLISRERGPFVPVSEAGTVKVEESAFRQTTSIVRQGSPLPLTQISVYRGASYADLRFDLDLSAVRATAKRHLQYGLALPISGDRTYVDGAGFVIRVPDDFLPGGEAPQRVPVHFIHAEGPSGPGVTLANIDAFAVKPDGMWLLAGDELEAQTRDEGAQPLEVTEPHGSRIQTFRFRVALQPADAAQWERFGVEANTPLEATPLLTPGTDAQHSFFEISSPSVQLLAFKPAESKPGWYVVRLQEIGGKVADNVTLTSELRLTDAVRANLVEVATKEPVDLRSLRFRPWETMTILVKAAKN
jgi:hypothetical protein